MIKNHENFDNLINFEELEKLDFLIKQILKNSKILNILK